MLNNVFDAASASEDPSTRVRKRSLVTSSACVQGQVGHELHRPPAPGSAGALVQSLEPRRRASAAAPPPSPRPGTPAGWRGRVTARAIAGGPSPPSVVRRAPARGRDPRRVARARRRPRDRGCPRARPIRSPRGGGHEVGPHGATQGMDGGREPINQHGHIAGRCGRQGSPPTPPAPTRGRATRDHRRRGPRVASPSLQAHLLGRGHRDRP